MYFLERIFGAETRQYRSRNFAQDVVYWLVNGSGVFRLTGSVVLLTLVHDRFPKAQLHLLESLPVWLQYIIFLIAYDLISYWVHRWQHISPFLWAFHTTHHSQQELSFATTARSHPVEQWIANIIILVPIAVILGGTPAVWFPIMLAQQFLFAMTHSRLDWNFGYFARVFVSPAFHSLHHSFKPEHHDRNFSGIFSFWDYLFGTAVEAPRREHACGLNDLKIYTFWDSLIEPFRLAYRAGKDGRTH